jgi:uncharacterized protein YndB with AHSA1/START domain
MAKWLVGCLVVAVVVVGSLVWFGYRKFKAFTSEPPIVTVMVQAPAERVYAVLADADSMKVWRSVIELRSSRRGLLQVGDTLYTRFRTVSMPQPGAAMQVDSGFQNNTEIVTERVPNRLLVVSLVGDSTNTPMMVRRDSLVPHGDSTEVVTSFAIPASESMRESLDTTRTAERRLLDMSLQLVLTVARVQGRMEQRRLKAHVEGTPLPPSRDTLRLPQAPLPPRSRQE